MTQTQLLKFILLKSTSILLYVRVDPKRNQIKTINNLINNFQPISHLYREKTTTKLQLSKLKLEICVHLTGQFIFKQKKVLKIYECIQTTN